MKGSLKGLGVCLNFFQFLGENFWILGGNWIGNGFFGGWRGPVGRKVILKIGRN